MSEDPRFTKFLQALSSNDDGEEKKPAEFEDTKTVILTEIKGIPTKCTKCDSGYGIEKIIEFKKKKKITCAECGKYIATLEFGDYGWQVTDPDEPKE